MAEFGLAAPYYIIILAWLVKIVILVLLSTFLSWLGIRVLDVLTPKIHKRERIGEDPKAVGLYIAGFFIFIGLVIHGAMSAPVVIGSLSLIIDYRRIGLIAISFLVSLLLGLGLFNLMDKLTPKIPFRKISETSMAVGFDVFGYYIFFGLIIHAALTMPL